MTVRVLLVFASVALSVSGCASRDVQRTDAGAVALAPLSLEAKRCGLDEVCFYDPTGALRARSSKSSYFPDRNKITVLTGGYSNLLAHQRAYLRWVGPRTSSPRRIRTPLPTGELTVSTLMTPVARLYWELDELWRHFKAECAAAAGSRNYPACRQSLYDVLSEPTDALPKAGEERQVFQPGPDDPQVVRIIVTRGGTTLFISEYLFPDNALQNRALRLKRVLRATAALESAIKPLESQATIGLFGKDERKDHLEPDRISSEFLRRLIELEANARTALEEAQLPGTSQLASASVDSLNGRGLYAAVGQLQQLAIETRRFAEERHRVLEAEWREHQEKESAAFLRRFELQENERRRVYRSIRAAAKDACANSPALTARVAAGETLNNTGISETYLWSYLWHDQNDQGWGSVGRSPKGCELVLIENVIREAPWRVPLGALVKWAHEFRIAPARKAWGKGNRALELQDANEAIKEYTRAIKIWPNFAAAYVSRGNAHLFLMENHSALADYESAIKIDPGYAQAYLARGMLRWLNGELHDAEGDFRELVRLLPEEPFYVARLARVLDDLHKSREVEELYHRLYHEDRRRDWALEPWLEAYSHNHGWEKMLAETERMEVTGGGSDTLLWMKAKGLMKLERFSQAIPILRQVLRGDPSKVPTDAALYLADAHKANRNRNGCREAMVDYAARVGRPGEADLSYCD